MTDKEFIKVLEEDLRHIILAYPVYGQHPYYDMVGKILNKVKSYNNPPPTPKQRGNPNQTFVGGENENCIHCGFKIGLHLYSTKRCPV
jgi:hypothetical protein